MQTHLVGVPRARNGPRASLPLEAAGAPATIFGMASRSEHGILGADRVGPVVVVPCGRGFSTDGAPLWNRWISGWLRLRLRIKLTNVSGG